MAQTGVPSEGYHWEQRPYAHFCTFVLIFAHSPTVQLDCAPALKTTGVYYAAMAQNDAPTLNNNMSWLTPPWHKVALPVGRTTGNNAHYAHCCTFVLIFAPSLIVEYLIFFPCGIRHGRLQTI